MFGSYMKMARGHHPRTSARSTDSGGKVASMKKLWECAVTGIRCRSLFRQGSACDVVRGIYAVRHEARVPGPASRRSRMWNGAGRLPDRRSLDFLQVRPASAGEGLFTRQGLEQIFGVKIVFDRREKVLRGLVESVIGYGC